MNEMSEANVVNGTCTWKKNIVEAVFEKKISKAIGRSKGIYRSILIVESKNQTFYLEIFKIFNILQATHQPP